MSTVHPRVCGERDSLAIWTIAAEKVGRACRELELNAPCVDVIARRYEPLTGAAAIPIETGETCGDLAARRESAPADTAPM